MNEPRDKHLTECYLGDGVTLRVIQGCIGGKWAMHIALIRDDSVVWWRNYDARD